MSDERVVSLNLLARAREHVPYLGETWKALTQAMTAPAQPLPTSDVPDRIYLQIDVESPDIDDCTWCRDKINETDVAYVRADRAAHPATAPAGQATLRGLLNEATPWLEMHGDDEARELGRRLRAALSAPVVVQPDSGKEHVHLIPPGTSVPSASSEGASAGSCDWQEEDPDGFMPGTYESACGELWSFTDGGVKENNVRFCHGCGKPVNVIPFPVPADDEDQGEASPQENSNG